MKRSYYTISEAAREVRDLHGISVPEWKLRRVVDAVAGDCPRAGLYRLIPASTIPALVAELRRLNWPRTRPDTTSCSK